MGAIVSNFKVEFYDTTIWTDEEITGISKGQIVTSCDTGNNEFEVLGVGCKIMILKPANVVNGLKIGTVFE